jgi:hypothetical protein
MRASRLLLLTAAALTALAATTVGTAARTPSEDGTLSVRDGRGTIVLTMRGGVIGRFARGKLTVTDSSNDANTVIVRGEEDSVEINQRKTVYTGNNIRYRIAAERRVVVKIEAVKINFSAVGRGEVLLDGRGNTNAGVFFDGSYSLNGDDYKSLPDSRERVELAAQASSG